jgi:hypothetical protein
VDSDTAEMALILHVLASIGIVDFHVGLVREQPEPVGRSWVVRELGEEVP